MKIFDKVRRKVENPRFLSSGDIFLIDDNTFIANVIKFLMTAPTVWHHIYRHFAGTQETVYMYHAGIFMANTSTTIEQQWKCGFGYGKRILNTKKNILIFRLKYIPGNDLINIAIKDVGKGYGVVHSIGKLLTWLTGIKWFARYFKEKNGEICINRLCKWLYSLTGYTFGSHNYAECTTHSVYKYVKSHPKLFQIVYERVEL